MTKRLLTLALAPIFALALAATASPAVAASTNADSREASVSAATHNCVDNYEWNTFQLGWGKGKVERLFDTRGWTVWQQGNYRMKHYWYCGAYWYKAKVRYFWNGYSWRADWARRV